MSAVRRSQWQRSLAILLALALPLSAVADDNFDLLKQQVETLQQQLEQMQEALKQNQEISASKEEVAQEVSELKNDIVAAAEWKQPNTLIHMAGYADVGYANAENSDGSFNIGSFSPIFHYQYRDVVMLEAELEMSITDEGETDIELEYLTIDYFLNDYVTLLGGRFLSPIGNFRQNLHPSWINKLASAPPGFGHDGAAPVSEVGFQARGGFPLGNMFTNYAAYIGNGPELNSVLEDDRFELEGVEAEGFGRDGDGKKVFGGRFGFMPIPGLEVGISAAVGKATVTAIELAHHDLEEPDEHDDDQDPGEHDEEEPDEHDEDAAEFAGDLNNEPARNYDVLGFDFAWRFNNLKLRGEYVKTKVGAHAVGVTASPGATWKTWYTQGSYLIPQSRWETVLRYTDFDSPHSSQDQKQWAVGLNYLFASSVIGKLTYEFNHGEEGSLADTNRWMFQLAYGF